MAPRTSRQRNEPEFEDIDWEEMPPAAILLVSVFLIGFGTSVSLGDLWLNLLIGGAGLVIAGVFFIKVGLLYRQDGIEKALNYAVTPPADRTEDYSVSLETSSGIERTDQGITLEHLKEIDPYDFEELVAKVWRNMGYEAKVTQNSQDRGVDVIAEKAEPYDEKILIQAKRKGEGNKVSAPTVRKVGGLKSKNNVDKVIIVTSTDYTRQAKEEASDYNVKTINGKKLLELYQKNVE